MPSPPLFPHQKSPPLPPSATPNSHLPHFPLSHSPLPPSPTAYLPSLPYLFCLPHLPFTSYLPRSPSSPAPNLLTCPTPNLLNFPAPLYPQTPNFHFPQPPPPYTCRRYQSLTDKSLLDSQPELYIHIVPDKTNNTLSIIDSGIGMTKVRCGAGGRGRGARLVGCWAGRRVVWR